MKKSLFYLFVLMISAAFAFTGCDTREDDAEDRLEEMEEEAAVEPVNDDKVFYVRDRDYTYAEREEWRANVNNAQAELDREIERLEAEAANAEGEAKEEYNEAIADLREKKNELNESLDRYGKVTEAEWNEFKSDVNSWFDDLEKDYNQTLNDLKTDDGR